MQSRERVAQGYPTAMVIYGIGVLPLIKGTKAAYPDTTQIWYRKDAISLGTFDKIWLYFNSLIFFSRVVGITPNL